MYKEKKIIYYYSCVHLRLILEMAGGIKLLVHGHQFFVVSSVWGGSSLGTQSL